LMLKGERQIDLLLTDVVMPGTRDGIALGAEARRIQPGIKVLHVTGYPERLDANSPLFKGDALIRKPVERRDLLQRVGHLLGRWVVDQNEVLEFAFRYWVQKAAGGTMPPRRALDPAEIKALLPHLSIFERVGSPMRYRCRLAGTKVVAAIGCNFADRFLDETMTDDDAAFLTRQLDRVIATGLPLYVASSFRAADSDLATERLLLPFGIDDGIQVVAVQTFSWGERPVTLHEIVQLQPHRTHAIQSQLSPLREAS
ncbi:MAG: PAS domain-containing protein, partial [Stellaceae bacterium]